MVHMMLFEQLAEISDWWEELLHRCGCQLHITDVGHGRVQQLLILRLVNWRRWTKTLLLLIDEFVQGADAVLSEVLEEVNVLLFPLPSKGDKGQLHWLCANTEPMDVHWSLHV